MNKTVLTIIAIIVVALCALAVTYFPSIREFMRSIVAWVMKKKLNKEEVKRNRP